MSEELKCCRFCGDRVGYELEVCRTHEYVGCLECGRRAQWRSRLGKYVCLNLDCEWTSVGLPDYRARVMGE